jgi:hypothetical protein
MSAPLIFVIVDFLLERYSYSDVPFQADQYFVSTESMMDTPRSFGIVASRIEFPVIDLSARGFPDTERNQSSFSDARMNPMSS